MKIRKLKNQDTVLMLEWMHDESVVCNMQTDFKSKTLDDCIKFIESAQTKDCIHLAVTSTSNNKYLTHFVLLNH